ncbi:Cytochrome b6-f complex iron-sulfur subunit [Paenibacillus plantiphilus]|uniref:Cytochrome b6-f complex iron-sulfur subunit n=1 Tax=Paenibacillus plantiphilus TaxID=2905650 RepID=A0ABN8GZW4_9BACL|nr:ubiquinol-cytochrome c reductase iron-sulfur subunit [Paenibacillus plantiphilus]CAH1218301.1 Cytochrome b6-f complex iron-sulfur subunit [Paenibacillus plantiphilus]
MSNHEHHEDTGNKPVKRSGLSRRQFLSYTLGGAGAFMAAGMSLPMIRFAVDPILKKKVGGTWIKVVEENKITNDPQEFKFNIHQVDGWYVSDPELSAWISKDNSGNYFALSPVCKHLGCTISWSSDIYICPCHNAHYTKDGENLTVAPKPLDEYDLKIDNGWVYLGPIKANTRV